MLEDFICTNTWLICLEEVKRLKFALFVHRLELCILWYTNHSFYVRKWGVIVGLMISYEDKRKNADF